MTISGDEWQTMDSTRSLPAISIMSISGAFDCWNFIVVAERLVEARIALVVEIPFSFSKVW
jgi:hypothetical protein